MKTNLQALSLSDQVVAVMRVLKRRDKSGARTTFSSDLLRYFKHRGFRSHQQRLAHYTLLHRAASEALCGKNVDAHLRELQRSAVIFEAGDEAMHDGECVRVLGVIEAERLATVGTLAGVRTVRLADLSPPAAVF